MRLIRWTGGLVLAASLLVVGAHPLQAQEGPPFTPPGPPPTRPPVTDRGGPFVGPVPPGLAGSAVQVAAARVDRALRAGRLAAADGTRFAPGLQASLTALFTDEPGTPGGKPARGADPLLEALAPPTNASAREPAHTLVAALEGLLVDPARLPAAVGAYNAYVRASTRAFLADPSPGFLAVHTVLGSLVTEASDGDGAH